MATQAHVLAEQGDREAALNVLAQLLVLQPGRADAWFNHAYLCEALGRVAEAETGFRRAIGLDPLLDRAWYGLGLSLIQQGRLDEAAAALSKNTELQPMNPYGWYQLARVHVDRQDAAAAERIIGHLAQFEPRVAEQLRRETGLGVTTV